MLRTERFRNQHNELLKIATDISAHLNVDELSHDAREVRSLLSQLLGKLTVHLSMEDKSLYPELLKHSDEKISSLARKFIDEMGGIGESVNIYKDKWSNHIRIKEDPSGFIAHTKDIFNALSERIEIENSELYNILDELE